MCFLKTFILFRTLLDHAPFSLQHDTSIAPCAFLRTGQIPVQLRKDSCFAVLRDRAPSHTSHPKFPATEPLSVGHLRNGERNNHFQGTLESKKIIINTTPAGNLLCIYNCICQWYDTDKVVPTPRTAAEAEDIDLEPDQLTDYAKRAEHVTSSRRLDVETYCESRNADSQRLPTRQNLPELLHAQNTHNQDILKVRDYKQFSPIMSRSDQ